MTLVEQHMEDISYDGAGLRQRGRSKNTPGNLSPILERDRSCSPTKEEPSWGNKDAPMHKLQQKMKLEFPEVIFTEEFCERETGTTSCLVGGITCDYKELEKYNEHPFELRFENGSLCLTHTTCSKHKVIIKKAAKKFDKRKIGIVMLWVTTMVAIGTFISVFDEKYNELLKDYSI